MKEQYIPQDVEKKMKKPRLLGIDHIEIIVKDAESMEAMIDFYRKMGFELTLRTDHHGGSAEISIPSGPVVEMHVGSRQEVIGINHVAYVIDDLDKAYEYLVSHHVKFADPPTFVHSTGRRLANLRDTEGWRVQLIDAKTPRQESDECITQT